MKSEITNKKIRESKCCISIEMHSKFEFFGIVLFLYRALVSVQIQASGNSFLTRWTVCNSGVAFACSVSASLLEITAGPSAPAAATGGGAGAPGNRADSWTSPLSKNVG